MEIDLCFDRGKGRFRLRLGTFTAKTISISLLFCLVLLQPHATAWAWGHRKPKTKADQTPIKTEIQATSQWKEVTTTPDVPSQLTFQAEFPDRQWWHQFHDPLLTAYIETALKQNQQLAIAEAKIREEKALAREALANEFPSISLAPSFARETFSKTLGFLSPTQVTSGGFSGFSPGNTINFYSVPLNVNYEADIWFKNRDKTRSANKVAEAYQRDYESTRMSLITSVSSAYFNLSATDQLIAVQKQYLASAEADVSNSQNRLSAGLVSQDEVEMKQAALANAKVQLQSLFQLQTLYEDQLTILIGKTPEKSGALPRKAFDQIALLTRIPVGVPAQLIQRRPDVLAAQDMMESANIDVRVARKMFLPTFALSGQFGYSTDKLAQLLDWQSHIVTLAATATQTLFSGGALSANLKVAHARAEEQLHQYQQTLLQSVYEVNSALGTLKTDQNSFEQNTIAVNSNNALLSVKQNQIEAGALAPLDITTFLQTKLVADEFLIKAKIAVLSDTLTLYKALGGGY